MTESSQKQVPVLFLLPLIFCCLCLGAIAPDQPAMAKEKKISGYVIEQESSKSGAVKVTVSANAIRFDAPGYACISKGPLWDVVMWRTDRKQFAQLSYKAWIGFHYLGASVDRSDITKSITERHFESKGNKFVVYGFPKTVSSGKMAIFQSGDGGGIARELKPQVDCLDWPDDIHPGAVIGRFCGLPPLRGIPVSITSSGKSYREWELRTKTIVHTDDLASTLFVMPSGLKKVPVSTDIFISDSTKGALEDYLGGAK